MVRFRTRYFNRFVERGIAAGARQVVLLGGGFDMRAHLFAGSAPVSSRSTSSPSWSSSGRRWRRTASSSLRPSSPTTSKADVPNGLAELGFDRTAPTLMVWEGNTMYLPPESILPFLNRLAEALTSFRIAFDYFAVDLQSRDFENEEDRRRLEDVERAMGANFPTGFADLKVFEEQAPFRVAEDGSFDGLAEEFGLGEMVANYPEDWRETLKLYRYCVLERR